MWWALSIVGRVFVEENSLRPQRSPKTVTLCARSCSRTRPSCDLFATSSEQMPHSGLGADLGAAFAAGLTGFDSGFTGFSIGLSHLAGRSKSFASGGSRLTLL